MPRTDILEEHRDTAAFLYARWRRSCGLLDGNRAQTRALWARIDAHVEALSLFPAASASLWSSDAVDDPGVRFVATAVSVLADPSGAGLGDDATAPLAARRAVELRDALLRYGSARMTPLLDAWLAAGAVPRRCVALELLARWRDGRALTIADRAVRRGEGPVRAAGAAALVSLGGRIEAATLGPIVADSGDASGWCDTMLDGLLRQAPSTALDLARRLAVSLPQPGAMVWVLLGLSAEPDDLGLLFTSWAQHGARGAFPAALALAGQHLRLDAVWDGAAALPVSNALREAAYVVCGGEAPPVMVRDDLPEEPEDVAQRASEDAVLRARMAETPAGPWRWGALAGTDRAQAVVDGLGPRPRRWGLAARALAGGTVGDWDDLSHAEAT